MRRVRRWLWLLIAICAFLIVVYTVHRPYAVRHATNDGQTSVPESQVQHGHDTTFAETGTAKYVAFQTAPVETYATTDDYVISGRVFTDASVPLPGATVSVHRSKPELFSVEWSAPMASQACDVQGQYSIHVNSPVHGYLVVRKEGFTQKDEEIDIRKPGEIQMNHYLQPAPACVEGFVFDHVGHPITGAYVTAVINNQVIATMSGSQFSAISQLTDTSGKYVINALPEAKVRISAISRSDVPASKDIEAKRGGCVHQDFQLLEGFVCSFIVKNVRGEPIPHPRVPGSVMSGENGVVTVITRKTPLVRGGLSVLGVSAPGYKSRSINMINPNDPPAGQWPWDVVVINPNDPCSEVVLQDYGPDPQTIKGRVVDERGAPVADATIRVGGKSVETDKDGDFVLPSGPSGTSFSVSKDGFIEQNVIPWDPESAAGVSGSGMTGIEIRLKSVEGGIYGRVLMADGNPARRFRIILSPPSGPVWTREFENQQGLFMIQDVPSGFYDVTIVSLPYSPKELIQNTKLGQIEIRKGFYYGEVAARLSPIEIK